MTKLEELLEIWNKDSFIDESQISSELLKIPQLHAKYLRTLNEHKMAGIKCKFEYDKLKNIKTEYYLGNLDKETLDEYGWEPFDLRIGAKSNVERYINSDDQLIKLLQKKAYHEQVASTCESILYELKNRSWQLKTFVDYQKFLSGA